MLQTDVENQNTLLVFTTRITYDTVLISVMTSHLNHDTLIQYVLIERVALYTRDTSLTQKLRSINGRSLCSQSVYPTHGSSYLDTQVDVPL